MLTIEEREDRLAVWEDVVLVDLYARRSVSHDILDDSGKDHSSVFAALGVDGPLEEHVVSGECSLVSVIHVQKDTPETVLQVERAEVAVTAEGVKDVDKSRHWLHIGNSHGVEHTEISRHTVELAHKVGILRLSHSVVGVVTKPVHECSHPFDILN